MGSWGLNISSCGQRRLWLDWADAQADLSLWWAQRPFCWLCHEVALLSVSSNCRNDIQYSDRQVWASSGHLNQTTPKGLHCLSFCWHLFYGKITLFKLQQLVQLSDDFLSTSNFFHMRKHEFICTFQRHMIWAAAWQNKENDLCAQQRLRSAWASAQSDQSLLSAWRNLWSSATHPGHSKDSDQTGWMHRLIWVVAWSTCHFVGFDVHRLIWYQPSQFHLSDLNILKWTFPGIYSDGEITNY